MKKKPIISVIIPYYRKRNYIKKTLTSVFSQSFKNFEVILIYDDQNLKDLYYIRKNFKSVKLRIIINKSNIGAGYSRNVAIEHSLGKYIAFLDADDYWHKDKLSLQLNFMEKNLCKISHTDYTIAGNTKNQKRIAKKLSFNEIIKSCDIGLSTVMLKKNILKKNLFPNLRTKEDYVLWLKILKSGIKIYPINKNLTIWRKTENSLSSNLMQKIKDGYSVYRHHLKQSPWQSLISLLRLSFNFIVKKLFNV